jgi:stage V sporulation protein B
VKRNTLTGYIYLSASNFFFVITSYGIYFGLGRILGPEEFGIYGIVTSFISILTLVLASGPQQAVAKFVAEDWSTSQVIKRGALRLQVIFGAATFFFCFSGAGIISSLLNDPSLKSYVRVASFICLFHPVSAVFLGMLNGLRRYGTQAIMDSLYSLVRMVLILGFALLSASALSALWGFVISTSLFSIFLYLLWGSDGGEGKFERKRFLTFVLPFTLFVFITNLILNIDLLMLKALSPKALSNLYGGYYTAASTLARIPYFFTCALSLVILPLVSQATSLKDHETTKRYVEKSLRYTLILLIPISFLISPTAERLMGFLYSKDYLPASESLSILVFGLTFFSLFSILTTIISAAGRPKVCLYFALIVLFLDVWLNYLFIPPYAMKGAALATTISLFLGVIGISLYCVTWFKTFLPWFSLLKILLSGVLIFALAKVFSFNGLLLIPFYLILSLVYILSLFILGELGKEDLLFLKER